jgi:hypothetical protein
VVGRLGQNHHQWLHQTPETIMAKKSLTLNQKYTLLTIAYNRPASGEGHHNRASWICGYDVLDCTTGPWLGTSMACEALVELGLVERSVPFLIHGVVNQYTPELTESGVQAVEYMVRREDKALDREMLYHRQLAEQWLDGLVLVHATSTMTRILANAIRSKNHTFLP